MGNVLDSNYHIGMCNITLGKFYLGNVFNWKRSVHSFNSNLCLFPFDNNNNRQGLIPFSTVVVVGVVVVIVVVGMIN